MNKETIETLKKMVEDGNLSQEIAEKYCPELKESEDEKIRKWLICTLKSLNNSPVQINGAYEMMLPAIAWLEKQGEQKPADKVEPKFKVGDWVVDEDDNSTYQIKRVIENVTSGNFSYDLVGGGYFASIKKNYHLWTIQDAKEGDVLSYRDGQWCFIYKGIVTEDTFKYYALLSEKGITVNDAAFSLLTSCIIPATKEQRELLFQKMKEAGYMWDAEKKKIKKIEEKPVEKFYSNELEEEIEVWVGEKAFPEGAKITPLPEAIKIVRETALHFQKWEAAHHIDGRSSKEQLEAKQDLTWSEEDECIMNAIYKFLDGSDALSVDQQQAKYWVKSFKDRIQPQPKQEWSEEDKEVINLLLELVYEQDKINPRIPSNENRKMMISWLKSLRPQNK